MDAVFNAVLARFEQNEVFRDGDIHLPITRKIGSFHDRPKEHICRVKFRQLQVILGNVAGRSRDDRITFVKRFVEVESTNDLTFAQVLTFIALHNAGYWREPNASNS